tara:strand:+ start:10247 stop:10927 length:681 start_codon:yes stop_codon:yes gene_type:complete
MNVSPDTIPTDTPLGKDERGCLVWGLPVSPQWLATRPEASARIEALADPKDGVPGWKALFASMVSSCLSEIEQWREQDIQVSGRDWVDVGCGFGHYALALKLLGANRVVGLDLVDPSGWAWAGPVLQAADVESAVGNANVYTKTEADSACVFGVTINLRALLNNNPGVSTLVLEEAHGNTFDRLLYEGWSSQSFTLRDVSYCALSADGLTVVEGDPYQVTVVRRGP